MLQITGDMWKEGVNYDAICITTNGTIRKSDGNAIMGCGCAKEAADMWPEIPALLGRLIKQDGNIVHKLKMVQLPPHSRCTTFGVANVTLFSFPVKPGFIIPLNKAGTFDPADQATVNDCTVTHMRGQFKPGQQIPGWACLAQPHLIEESARQLVQLIHKINERSAAALGRILLPRPGCGSGELRWENIRPILSEILDDRFTVITRKS